jgi:hypothetical protein
MTFAHLTRIVTMIAMGDIERQMILFQRASTGQFTVDMTMIQAARLHGAYIR